MILILYLEAPVGLMRSIDVVQMDVISANQNHEDLMLAGRELLVFYVMVVHLKG